MPLEKDLKADLVATWRLLIPNCWIQRHEDLFHSGVPDISVSHGVTLWIEVKRNDEVPTKIQAETIAALRRASSPCWVLAITVSRPGVWSVVVDDGSLKHQQTGRKRDVIAALAELIKDSVKERLRRGL